MQYWNLGNCEDYPIGTSELILKAEGCKPTGPDVVASTSTLIDDEENAMRAVEREGSIRCGTAV